MAHFLLVLDACRLGHAGLVEGLKELRVSVSDQDLERMHGRLLLRHRLRVDCGDPDLVLLAQSERLVPDGANHTTLDVNLESVLAP